MNREIIIQGFAMAIAKKINGFITQSSFIRKMFEEGVRLKQKYGAENVFDFSLGNPNLDPPEAVKARLRELVSAEIPGKHMYMPNAGYPETRAAVAAELSASRGSCAHGRPDRDDLRRRRGAQRHPEDDSRSGRRGDHPGALLRGVPFLCGQCRRRDADCPAAGGFLPRSRCDPGGR